MCPSPAGLPCSMPTRGPLTAEDREKPRAADRAPPGCCRLSTRAQGTGKVARSLLGDQPVDGNCHRPWFFEKRQLRASSKEMGREINRRMEPS